MYYVYLARCANGTYYTGYTSNVEQRMKAHNRGSGGKYTRANRPLELVGIWEFNDKKEALKIERFIKRLSPAKKLKLLETAIPDSIHSELDENFKSVNGTDLYE